MRPHVFRETRLREGADRADWFDSLNWWQGSERGNRIIAYRIIKEPSQ